MLEFYMVPALTIRTWVYDITITNHMIKIVFFCDGDTNVHRYISGTHVVNMRLACLMLMLNPHHLV